MERNHVDTPGAREDEDSFYRPDSASVLRALLVSVGGSPPPIVASIARQRPEVLIFFVSPGSRAMVKDEILPALPADYRYLGIEFIETPSEQLVNECFRVLVQQIPPLLSRHRITYRDLRADFTGGTKPMSAAVMLALAGRIPDFSYVGAADKMARDKGGLGIVVNGMERLLICGDPWTVVAESQLSDAADLFGSGRYGAARAVIESLMRRGFVSPLSHALRGVSEGFAAWDSQRYEEAKKALTEAGKTLAAVGEGRGHGPLLDFSVACQKVLPSLERTHLEWKKLSNADKGKQDFSGLDGLAIPLDLCAAAKRRVEQRNDPEDGTMLLYAAVEKLAKGRLIIKYGINNSKCRVEELGGIRDEVLRKQTPEKGLVKLASLDSFRLLQERKDEIGTRFVSQKSLVEKLGSVRNLCWREHGYIHVELSTFKELFEPVLELIGAKGEDLVMFPVPDGS